MRRQLKDAIGLQGRRVDQSEARGRVGAQDAHEWRLHEMRRKCETLRPNDDRFRRESRAPKRATNETLQIGSDVRGCGHVNDGSEGAVIDLFGHQKSVESRVANAELCLGDDCGQWGRAEVPDEVLEREMRSQALFNDQK
jgi:hypothetical protein